MGDYVCLPTAEQIEKTRLKKLAEMEAKKQEAAAAAAADAQTIKTEKAQEKEEFEGDEEEMALLRELMGKQQPQQTSSLHERELKYREQTKGKDYFGNVKDDGEEEEEEVYVPKLKIKDAAADAVKPPPVAHPGGTDDTNEVEMELEDDEGVPTLPPSTATYPAYPEPCAGPQMPAMPGPGYPEAAPYPEAPYPEPYPAGTSHSTEFSLSVWCGVVWCVWVSHMLCSDPVLTHLCAPACCRWRRGMGLSEHR